MYRFRKVAFIIISSPFLQGATAKHHLHIRNTSLATAIAENIYVDK